MEPVTSDRHHAGPAIVAAATEAFAEYERRASSRRATVAARGVEVFRISQWRLGVFGAFALAAFLAWRGLLSPGWLAIPVAAFAVLVKLHDRAIRARDDAARALVFYERGLARIEDRWIGTGEAGDRFSSDEHLYAADLDLFGRGSLFELLSIARTRAGEETLAAWLKAPATLDEVASRHTAVTELTPALDLREALSLAGSEVAAGVHTDDLTAWAEGPQRLGHAWQRSAAIALTAVTIACLVLVIATGAYGPLLLALIVQSVFALSHRLRVAKVLHAASAPARDLAILRHLVQRLEGERFESPKLAGLRQRVMPEGTPASIIIGRLIRLVEAHEWEHNIIFAPVAAFLNWGTHIAWAIERWRQRHGHEIGEWLRAAGEVEALSSLSAYRFEHPGDCFPDLAVAPTAVFDGIELGHPLLPEARMVRNDVRLDGNTRLLVVSGSNMSGKSTLLRTVGINAVLAYAGAPVRARRLRLTPLAIGGTLRIQDSLQEGRSRFFAEITRIRAIVEQARGSRPMLFLLDELFHGTNSHDRLVGATGVLRSLLHRGAVGLITTHDLALTGVADHLAPRAANVHFEDRIDGGQIGFDYRMKPGPVTRSNALALMRAVGLEVEDARGPSAE
jgi:hypothetical protein